MCNLEAKLSQHKQHTTKGDIWKSAFAEHTCLFDHFIDLESVNVLDNTKDFRQCKITEALRIPKQQVLQMKKDQGRLISEAGNAAWF